MSYPKIICGPDAPYQWRCNLAELRRIRFGRPIRKWTGQFNDWGRRQPDYVTDREYIEGRALLASSQQPRPPTAITKRRRVWHREKASVSQFAAYIRFPLTTLVPTFTGSG